MYLTVSGFAAPVIDEEATTGEKRDVEGWTLYLSAKLLKEQKAAVEAAMPFLRKQLQEIVREVPAPAVARMREIAIFFTLPPKDGKGTAEYHPEVEWLRENGRDPAMARGVQVSDVANFEQETLRMPNFILHELAHGYHDRVLGFEQKDILSAYQAAKEAKLYDRVERSRGYGKPNTFERAYAMSDHKEYFSETTEAYFSQNDFFPFNRSELIKHDPKMVAVLEKVWGVEKSALTNN
jgi:dipeptidyl-peptidase-4